MRFTAMNRGRGKLAMATAALGIGLLSLTGCGYINAQQTTEQYSSSDGTRTDLGALQLRNFIIVSDGEDKPGRVIGAVYNTSSNDVVLTIKGAEGSQTQVPVKKNSYTMLNDSSDAVMDSGQAELIADTHGASASALLTEGLGHNRILDDPRVLEGLLHG